MIAHRRHSLSLVASLALGAAVSLGQSSVVGQTIPTDRHGDPLPPGALARMGTTRLRGLGYRIAGAFSPDGKVLAIRTSGTFGGEILLWEIPSGRLIRRFAGLGSWNGDISFSPNGKILAVSDEKSVSLVDPVTGKQLRRLPAHSESLACFAFSPDSRAVATAGGERFRGKDFAIRLWDVASGLERRRFTGHQGRVDQLAFTPDGRWLVSCNDDLLLVGPTGPESTRGAARLWDTATGKLCREHPTKDHRITIAGNAATLAYRDWDETLRLRSLITGKTRPGPKIGEHPFFRFSPDGRVLAVFEHNSALCLVEAETGREFPCPKAQGPEIPLCLSFNGSMLATVRYSDLGPAWTAAMPAMPRVSDVPYSKPGPGWTIRLWDVASGTEVGPEPGGAALGAVAFSPDGQVLVTGRSDGVLEGWATTTGRRLGHLQGHGSAVMGLAFSPNGRIVASAGADSTLGIWRTATGSALIPEQRQQGGVASMAFPTNGKKLVASDALGAHHTYDLGSGEGVHRVEPFQTGKRRGLVSPLVLSPDGRTCALVRASEPQWRIWSRGLRLDSRPRRYRPTNQDPAAPMVRPLFSPDGRFVVTMEVAVDEELQCWGGHKIRLWEVASGQQVMQIIPSSDVWCLALAPDGRTLAAGTDPTPGQVPAIYSWDLATGKELGQLRGHLAAVNGIAFSPDGRLLASASDDGTALIWKAPRLPPDLTVAVAARMHLTKLLEQLSSENAPAAYQAVCKLVAVPNATLAYLRQNVRAVSVPTPEHLAVLIAKLDSRSYRERDQATRELDMLGELAEPALRKAPAGKPSLETSRRIELLLTKLEQGTTTERQWAARVTGVLEHIGSLDARRHLQELAKGAPQAQLTREAQGSLQRLAARLASGP
jgi:WD40 repeat protein